ncbi:MAG: hypothetical protein LN413_00195 [Candidatus Thermoplasmatota archaeon]|nr:hypothetical protein [Candidatus Thermoplasmatota archaeon]
MKAALDKITEDTKLASARSSIKTGGEDLSCEKCRVGRMTRAEPRRLSENLASIGSVLVVLACVGIALSTLGVLGLAVDLHPSPPIERLLDTLGFAPFIVALGYSVPVLIVGLLLMLKRKVWKCTTCGYVFDRA